MAAIVVKGVRPTKQAPIPPPLYLTAGETTSYCHTCGRLVGSRKLKSPAPTARSTRFCSEKCKRHRPAGGLDGAIEAALWRLLDEVRLEDVVEGQLPAEVADTRRRPTKKGEARVVVPCSLVESLVFARVANVNHRQGRRERKVAEAEGKEGKVDEGYDEEALKRGLERLRARREGGGKVEEAEESRSETEDEEEEEDDGEMEKLDPAIAEQRRKDGQVRAAQRERVRNACRRAVVFGLPPPGTAEAPAQEKTDAPDAVDTTTTQKHKKGKSARSRRVRDEDDDDEGPATKHSAATDEVAASEVRRRKCEAVMSGSVVEPSFAKGDWGVRWRA